MLADSGLHQGWNYLCTSMSPTERQYFLQSLNSTGGGFVAKHYRSRCPGHTPGPRKTNSSLAGFAGLDWVRTFLRLKKCEGKKRANLTDDRMLGTNMVSAVILVMKDKDSKAHNKVCYLVHDRRLQLRITFQMECLFRSLSAMEDV